MLSLAIRYDKIGFLCHCFLSKLFLFKTKIVLNFIKLDSYAIVLMQFYSLAWPDNHYKFGDCFSHQHGGEAQWENHKIPLLIRNTFMMYPIHTKYVLF